MKKQITQVIATATLMIFSLSSNAMSFDRIVVFGDSQSDGGYSNTARQSLIKNSPGATPEQQYAYMQTKSLLDQLPVVTDPDYADKLEVYQEEYNKFLNLYGCSFEGRGTNGYTTVEQAAIFHNKYTTEKFFNYSVYGASSSNLESQRLEMEGDIGTLSSNDLVIINIGANDLWDLKGGANTPQQIVDRVRGNIYTVMAKLAQQNGARKFVIANMSDVTRRPAFTNGFKGEVLDQATLTLIADAKDAIAKYNTKGDTSPHFGYTQADIDGADNGLARTVRELYAGAAQVPELSGIEIHIFDNYGAFNALLDSNLWPEIDPNTYDDTDVIMEKCASMLNGGIISSRAFMYNLASFDKFIYFDRVHLSRRSHAFLGTYLGALIRDF